QKARYLQERRKELLKDLQEKTRSLLSSFFGKSIIVDMEYKARGIKYEPTYHDFMYNHQELMIKEQAMQRSLFGAHLDDISIRFDSKQSKLYASRGQQKLTVFMLKAALAEHITQNKGRVVLLLDDFMGDFDPNVLDRLYDLLKHL